MLVLRRTVLGLLLAGLSVGCGGGADPEKGREPRTPVSGVVMHDGKPVEGATVMLHSNMGGKGATGVTNSSGAFKLGTYGADDGALPGEYKVSVRKLEAAPTTKQPGPDEPGYDPNPKPFVPKHLLPEKYADFTKSGLTATVGKEAVTDLKFELK